MLTSWFNLLQQSPEVPSLIGEHPTKTAAYIHYSSTVNRVMKSDYRDRIGGETIIGMSVIVK